MVRRMRTNKKVGSKIKRKWGSIGAPHSAKRKAHLASIRKGKGKGKARKTSRKK